MKIQKIPAQLLTLGVTATLLGAINPQAAALTVDNFLEATGGFQGVQVDGMGPPTSFNEDGPFLPANTIGGFRDLEIQRIVNMGNPFATATGAVFNGNLEWSNDLGFSSMLTVQWDGGDGSGTIDPTGLGGVDFTDGGMFDRFGLDFLSVDQPGLTVELTVYTDGGNSSILTETLTDPIFVPEERFFEFSDFAVQNGSGADFTDVGALQLKLTGPASIDAQIALLELAKPPIPDIPEPSTLLGLGLIGGFGLLSANKKAISKS